MIVDDDGSHLDMVRDFLDPIGFNVLVANNAETARDMLADISPDVFILDIDLPGTDGWTLAERLRSGKFRTTPIIIISGHAAEVPKSDRNSALCDAFLSKPYNLDDLVSRIADLLKLDFDVQTTAPNEATALPAKSINRLSADWIERLIPLADIGHARGLMNLIEEIETSYAPKPSPVELTHIQRLVRSYDMDSLSALLEEERRRAG